MSGVRQNYAASSEAAVNTRIHGALETSYAFLAIGNFFDRDDVALKGMEKYFTKLSEEHRGEAWTLMHYQNSRGGRVKLQTLAATPTTWTDAASAFVSAMGILKATGQAYSDLHDVADAASDAHLADFVEDKFLGASVERIKDLGDKMSGLKLAGAGLGEYVFDKETMGGESS